MGVCLQVAVEAGVGRRCKCRDGGGKELVVACMAGFAAVLAFDTQAVC